MHFINKQSIRAVVLAGAALLALGACSSSGNTDSGADGANQPPAASSEAQGTGNTDGAPDKAMAMTEPGSDPNATCNLFQVSEVTPLVGELEQEGYPNPMNDRYIGGRINSCAWHGEKSSLELIIVGDGQASVVYRQNIDAADEAQPMCGGHLGSLYGDAVCVFGDVMYVANVVRPQEIDDATYDPPTDEELAVFMQQALERTGGVKEVSPDRQTGKPQDGSAQDSDPASGCNLLTTEEVAAEIGSPVTFTTEFGPCQYIADNGFTVILTKATAGDVVDGGNFTHQEPDPFPGCKYGQMGTEYVMAYCEHGADGYIFTGRAVTGESLDYRQKNAMPRLIQKAMSRA